MVETSSPRTSVEAHAVSPHLEHSLLLLCARTSVELESALRIKELVNEGIDWTYLGQTASAHGVLPLLYRSLEAVCPDAVPQNFLDRLELEWSYNSNMNRLRTGILLELLDLFTVNEISAVPFKGPVLAASVYGDLALRQFNDLDIVVRKQDFLRAKNVLVSHGYRPRYKATGANEARYLLSHNEAEFWRDDGMVSVDLHWGFTQTYSFLEPAPEGLWKRLMPVSLAGRTVPTFSMEDSILLLCLHGTKDRWRRLEWICDLAELIQSHSEINWEWIIEHAHKLGIQRMLFIGLLLSINLLGSVLPEQVLEKIQADPMAKRVAGMVSDGIFPKDENHSSGTKRFTPDLKVIERRQDKVRYCIHRVLYRLTPTPNDWSFLQLPETFSWVYFLIRPIRQVRDYTSKLFKQR